MRKTTIDRSRSTVPFFWSSLVLFTPFPCVARSGVACWKRWGMNLAFRTFYGREGFGGCAVPRRTTRLGQDGSSEFLLVGFKKMISLYNHKLFFSVSFHRYVLLILLFTLPPFNNNLIVR